MAEKREPYHKKLSDYVGLSFGFKDARAELKIRPDFGPTITVTLKKDQVEAVKSAFDAAYLWAQKPEAERKESIVERALDARGRARWGYPDAHIELSARLTKFLPWIPFTITKDELLEGKPAVDEVWAWAELPSQVRDLQGLD